MRKYKYFGMAILTASSLCFAGLASAQERAPYQDQPQSYYQQQNKQMMMNSGHRLHDAAIDFMQRAQNGQIPPEQRRMFESMQGQANDLMRRLQNGQLTPQERAVYEQTQKMMRDSFSY